MSQANVEIVHGLLEGFARRDHEAAFNAYDANIEWDATAGANVNPDIATVFHGHDGVRAYWRAWLSAWRDLEFEVQEVLDAGDDVVALIHNQRQWDDTAGLRPRCLRTRSCSPSSAET